MHSKFLVESDASERNVLKSWSLEFPSSISKEIANTGPSCMLMSNDAFNKTLKEYLSTTNPPKVAID